MIQSMLNFNLICYVQIEQKQAMPIVYSTIISSILPNLKSLLFEYIKIKLYSHF